MEDGPLTQGLKACRQAATRAAHSPQFREWAASPPPRPSSSPPPSSQLLFSQPDGGEGSFLYHTAIEKTAAPLASQEVVIEETPFISSGNSSPHRSPPVRPSHPPPSPPSPLAQLVELISDTPDIANNSASQALLLLLLLH